MANSTQAKDAKIERRRRWLRSMIKMAADIAKEKGVTVRLEADGAISVSTGAFPGLVVEEQPVPRLVPQPEPVQTDRGDFSRFQRLKNLRFIQS